MEEVTTRSIVGGILMVLIAGNFIMGLALYDKQSTSSSCQEIKDILYYENLELEIVDESEWIYDYYSLSSEAYDISDYDDAIYYCKESRDLSSKYSQKLREIKVKYPDNPSEILELRLEMINTEIKYLFALYQACEYTESAARAYKKGDYSSGDINIKGQNEQIEIHDDTVENYFNLEAEYQHLKQEIITS